MIGVSYVDSDLSVLIVPYLPTSCTRFRRSVELTNFLVFPYLESARALDPKLPQWSPQDSSGLVLLLAVRGKE